MGISLLLHLLLLWPTVAPRPEEEPLPALMATLRQPPVLPDAGWRAPPAPVPLRAPAPVSRPAAIQSAPVAPLAVPSATAVAAPRSELISQAAAPAVAPQPAASAAQDGSAEGLRQYRLALAVEARRHKRYPPRAQEAGIGGTAEVRVDIVDGRAAEVSLARPSGDASLDAAALDMIRKAAPRATVPDALRRRSFVVSLPIVFDPED